MSLPGGMLRMTAFLSESEQVQRRPLSSEIVHRAHAVGLSGAGVRRGTERFGASSRVHTTRMLSVDDDDLPVLVVIVDDAQKVRTFLPQAEELIAKGLIVLDEVEVVRRTGGPAGHRRVDEGDVNGEVRSDHVGDHRTDAHRTIR